MSALFGPFFGSKKKPFGLQNEPARSSRAIADSWRGLYGSGLFSSILGFIKSVIRFSAIGPGLDGTNLNAFEV